MSQHTEVRTAEYTAPRQSDAVTLELTPWRWSAYWESESIRRHYNAASGLQLLDRETPGTVVLRVSMYVAREEYGLEATLESSVPNPWFSDGGLSQVRHLNRERYRDIEVAVGPDVLQAGMRALAARFAQTMAYVLNKTLKREDAFPKDWLDQR